MHPIAALAATIPPSGTGGRDAMGQHPAAADDTKARCRSASAPGEA